MGINNIVIILIRCIIIAIYLLWIVRYNKAKRMDGALAFSFDVRSWIEIAAVIIGNLCLMFIPVTQTNVGFMLALGYAMLIISFLHLRRFVVVGKKVVFMMEHPFDVKSLSNLKYHKGVMHISIKGQSFKVRYPIGNKEKIEERLSGKYFRKSR
ncbi:MAG: hypothetical protein RR565_01225 [Erysipelothrix sp.]